MTSLLLATRNLHKTREFAEILGPEFRLSDLADAKNFPIVEETGRTFEENATLKALAISRVVPGLVVADDSGLVVEALGNAPGIFSARYAGAEATDAQNVEKLLAEMRENENRAAWFCCVLALAREGEILSLVRGTLDGAITLAARGDAGFGYDPIFIPRGFDRTLAELGGAIKNRISHRAHAIKQLRTDLARRLC